MPKTKPMINVYSSKTKVFSPKNVVGYIVPEENYDGYDFPKQYDSVIAGVTYTPAGMDVLSNGKAVVIMKATDKNIEGDKKVIAYATTLFNIAKLAQRANVDEQLFKLKKYAFVALVAPEKKKGPVMAKSLLANELPPMSTEVKKFLEKSGKELPDNIKKAIME